MQHTAWPHGRRRDDETDARNPLLRQRSRPYLFSNSLTPAIVTAALRALEIVSEDSEPRRQLIDNSAYFRESMTCAGFDLAGDNHPIIPVMIGDASLAQHLAEKLLEKNIYVTAFSFPVVPTGQARIRPRRKIVRDDSGWAAGERRVRLPNQRGGVP